MENPFKPNDKVMTKVKGADVQATVAQVFKNEVQVKTADDKLLWRTMHTVWYPGASPIPKPEKPKAEAAQEPAPVAPVAPAENSPQPDVVPPVEPAPSTTVRPRQAARWRARMRPQRWRNQPRVASAGRPASHGRNA